MARRIKFGGPNLKPGQKTWFDKINADGSYGGQPFVYYGEVVDESEIGKIVAVGEREQLVPNSAYYLDGGMATVEEEAATEA